MTERISPSYSKIHTQGDDIEYGAAKNFDKAGVSDGEESRKEVKASRLLTLARPEWGTMGIGSIFLILTQLGTMALPWFFGQLIDTIADKDLEEEEARRRMKEIVFQVRGERGAKRRATHEAKR